jgi:hypothetical protein
MFIPCINGQLWVEGSIGTIIIYFKLFRLFLNLQKEINSVMVRWKNKIHMWHQNLQVSLLARTRNCIFSISFVSTTYMYQYTIQYSPGEYRSSSKPNVRNRKATQYACSWVQIRSCFDTLMHIFCTPTKARWTMTNIWKWYLSQKAH